MASQATAMHVARIRGGHTGADGQRREYESAYRRRTFREGGKVGHETLANLSGLPDRTVDLIEAALKGTPLVPAGQAVTIAASVPHGHVAAVHAMAVRLGLPAVLGPPCAERDLALALVISRVAAPASKLSTLAWWADTTIGTDLGVAAASTDQVYAAMDWLAGRQDRIEAKLAARHLAAGPNPARTALFDLSSSWLEGRRRPLAARVSGGDHCAGPPRHQKPDGRGRPAADVSVRSAEPGRDHQPGLPRRGAGRLPQPGPGRRPGPHPQRAAGRYRETADPDHRPGPGRQTNRPRRDPPRGRQGDPQVKHRAALR